VARGLDEPPEADPEVDPPRRQREPVDGSQPATVGAP
jgi:hypothetical protein